MDEVTTRRIVLALTDALILYYKRGINDAITNLIASVEAQEEKFVLLEELESVRAALPVHLDTVIQPLVEETRESIKEFFAREEARKQKESN